MTLRFDGPNDAPAADSPFRGLRRLRPLYLLAFALTAIVMGAVVWRKGATEFEFAYVLTAKHFLAGRGMYALKVPPGRSFTYPPSMVLVALPFSLGPRLVGRVLWYLTNLACGVWLCHSAWRLSGGGPWRDMSARDHRIAWTGLAFGLPYALSGLDHQQTDILIAALTVGGAYLLSSNRPTRGAALIGLAAGLKCTPLLFAPYLLWKGRHRAALTVAVVAIGINLVPNLLVAPHAGGLWLVEWFERFLQPMGRSGYLPGRWYAWILDNQSISGAVTRWATTSLRPGADGLALIDRATPPDAATLRRIAYGIEALLLALSAAVIGWVARRPARGDSAAAPRPALEASIVLCLMLLLSPMTSRPHLVTLLLPGLSLGRAIAAEHRRMLLIPLYAALLAGFAALPLFGRDFARLAMWSGALSWSALFLLAGSLAGLTLTTKPAVTDAPARRHPHRRESPFERIA